jgi:hypothetical protein
MNSLHRAAQSGDVSQVKQLLESKQFDVDVFDEYVRFVCSWFDDYFVFFHLFHSVIHNLIFFFDLNLFFVQNQVNTISIFKLFNSFLRQLIAFLWFLKSKQFFWRTMFWDLEHNSLNVSKIKWNCGILSEYAWFMKIYDTIL